MLLIVAAAERKVRPEVGYGLASTLTDTATKIIIEGTILPHFKTADVPGRIEAGTAAIAQLLVGYAGAKRAAPQASIPADGGQSAAMPVWRVIFLSLAGSGLRIFCTVIAGRGRSSVIMRVLFVVALSGLGGSSQGRSSVARGLSAGCRDPEAGGSRPPSSCSRGGVSR